MQVGIAAEGAIGAARHDDVLVVTMAGAVTRNVYEAAICRVSREADERPIGALILDLTRVDPQGDWDDVAHASEVFCLSRRVRCGLVVPTWMLLSARSKCFHAQTLGLTWIAFLRLPDALVWAESWTGTSAHAPLAQFRFEHPIPRFLH
jgi:hypothetical protein